MNWQDAHLHLQDDRLRQQVNDVIDGVTRAGVVSLVVNGTQPSDWPLVAQLANEFPIVRPCFGLHPWYANEAPDDWEDELQSLLEAFPQAGVGEIGLDRWIEGHSLTRQQPLLVRQLELANRYDRPASIHCLRAWGALEDSLGQVPPARPFLLHSYGGPPEMIPGLVKAGAYFSISGYFFREDKVKKRETFRRVPRERLLVESDAPDMLPPQFMIAPAFREAGLRGINRPENLVGIYEATASWLGIALEELAEMVAHNFHRFWATDTSLPVHAAH